MQYREFKQKTYLGVERTIYEAKVGTERIQTDSLEKLREFIKNHVPNVEGTFRDN
jgi:hypothetical protein